MSKLDNGVYYFSKDSSALNDKDQGFGYVSILNNSYHAIGKPALVSKEKIIWAIKGKLHREDGPAIEYVSGQKEWYKNDKRHREDGPAIEYTDGQKEYYINGKEISEEIFNNSKIKKSKKRI